MKMLIVFLTMISSVAMAGDRNTAYGMVCKDLTFESDRNKCVETIRPHSYFDDQALAMCAAFTFDSNKIQCLGLIGGKQYDAYEIDACRNTTFDSDRLRCLQTNGRPANNRPCLPRQEVLGQLQAGLTDLRVGNLGTVDKRLQYLIANFSNPSCQ
jgi:hypothetical protein